VQIAWITAPLTIPNAMGVGAGGGANVVFPVGTADEPEKK